MLLDRITGHAITRWRAAVDERGQSWRGSVDFSRRRQLLHHERHTPAGRQRESLDRSQSLARIPLIEKGDLPAAHGRHEEQALLESAPVAEKQTDVRAGNLQSSA